MIALRPYQLAAVDAIEGAFASAYRSTLLVHSTGTGKTTSATEVIRRHLGRVQGARPSAVLVLAHRRELLSQFRDRLTAFDIASALARGAANARRALRAVLEGKVRVVVASVQTMARRLAAEPEAWPEDAFDLVVVDEAQHCPAHGYRNILSHFPRARVLGLTATPDRLDQVALGTVFQHLAHRYDLQEAVAAGYLCRARGVRVEVEGLDLSRVRQKIVRGTGGVPAHAVRDAAGAPAAPGAAKTPEAGHVDLPAASVGEVRDLHPGDLGRAFIAPQAVEGVVGPLLELAGSRRTIVFAVDRAHAAALAEALAARGAAAIVIHGGMRAADRADALAAFRAGDAQFCVNVLVLTEGFDMPEIECVALARPTQSRIFVAQAIGRALRPHESKDHALVLDFTSATSRFSLVGPEDVLGGDGMLGPVTRYARRAGAGVAPYAASRRWRARFTTWVVDLLRRVTGRELREGAGGGGADGKGRGARAGRGSRGISALARRAWVWLAG